ncbi:MAG: response regulator transcription factor [Rubrobacteraceae bacterium]|nr:response regulator transcription factor [Rubrobacteraceae bacterium]MCL6438651.1 response regulator transcription factor [Rubrobacteraceae bacterium]
MRVLLVEDHPTMRLGIRAALGLADDVEVIAEAIGAGDALHLNQKLKPDVVLLDLHLGGEPRGAEICRRIKELPDPPRVLVYSAYNSEEDILLCRLSGADGYLHKSEGPEKLLEALREVHRGGRMWLEGREEGHPGLQDVPGITHLTPKEKEVLHLLLERCSNAQIAEQLYISERTAKFHVKNILKKLGFSSRRELFRHLTGS